MRVRVVGWVRVRVRRLGICVGLGLGVGGRDVGQHVFCHWDLVVPDEDLLPPCQLEGAFILQRRLSGAF